MGAHRNAPEEVVRGAALSFAECHVGRQVSVVPDGRDQVAHDCVVAHTAVTRAGDQVGVIDLNLRLGDLHVRPWARLRPAAPRGGVNERCATSRSSGDEPRLPAASACARDDRDVSIAGRRAASEPPPHMQASCFVRGAAGAGHRRVAASAAAGSGVAKMRGAARRLVDSPALYRRSRLPSGAAP